MTKYNPTENPFKLPPPFCISFSGGRTSSYMLKRILGAYRGQLPQGAHVIFTNTGKELEETYEFVRDCSVNWNVPVTWLEFDRQDTDTYREVDFRTASRNGEPFEKLVLSRGWLPNRAKRMCTSDLKIRVMVKYMKAQGYDFWREAIGFRADEPQRVMTIRTENRGREEDHRDVVFPLHASGIRKAHILQWWSKQPFDLKLPDNGNGKTLAGNCDLCFIKSEATLKRLIREQPERADWWIEMEEKVRAIIEKKVAAKGGTFKTSNYGQFFYEYTFKQLKESALKSKGKEIFPAGEEGGISCYCGD